VYVLFIVVFMWSNFTGAREEVFKLKVHMKICSYFRL